MWASKSRSNQGFLRQCLRIALAVHKNVCLVLVVLVLLNLLGFQPSISSIIMVPFDSRSAQEHFTSLLANRSVNNEILVTVTNDHYLELTSNLLCSLKKNNINNFVIGALDRKSYKRLKADNLPVFAAFALGNASGQDMAPGRYGSKAFNALNILKELAVLEALKLGYQTFLIDSDVVFRTDPREFIRDTYKDYDFAFQSDRKPTDAIQHLNAGLYYARPTNASVIILEEMIRLKRMDPSLKDQPPLRMLLCDGPKRLTNVTCHDPGSGAKTAIMDPLDFVGSNRFNIIQKYTPHTYHFTTYARVRTTSQKKQRMKALGVWLLNGEGECLANA